MFVSYTLHWHKSFIWKLNLSMIFCCFDIKGLKDFFFRVQSVYFSAVNSSIQLCSIVVLSYRSFVIVQNDLSPFVPILPWSLFWFVGFPRRRINRMDFFSTPAQDCLSEWRALMKTACQFPDQLLTLTLQSWHCIYIVMAFGPSSETSGFLT